MAFKSDTSKNSLDGNPATDNADMRERRGRKRERTDVLCRRCGQNGQQTVAQSQS